MNGFNLSESLEYTQILSSYKIIENIFASSEGDYISTSIKAAASLIGSFPALSQSLSASSNLPGEADLLKARLAMFSAFISPEMLDAINKSLAQNLSKNISLLTGISNYIFAKRLLWHDFLVDTEIKQQSGMQANDSAEIKMARLIRKKAEENYKNNRIEDALLIFLSVEEKSINDFFSYYQIGLIYFFDKSDYNGAINYFRKAARYSQNHCKKIFSNSLLFIGLLLRLFAVHENDRKALEISCQNINQAFKTDPANYMASYALGQSLCMHPDYNNNMKQIKNIIIELVKADDIFLLQFIFDRSFDNALSEIDKISKDMYNEAYNDVLEQITETLQDLDKLSADSAFAILPVKISGFKHECHNIKEELGSNKNYYFIIETLKRAQRLSVSVKEVLKEVIENKIFAEFKLFIEDITKKYIEHISGEIFSPLTAAEKELETKKKELIALNRSYPIQRTENLLRKLKESSTEYQDIVLGDDWRAHKIYGLVKSITGCFFFTLGLTFIFIYMLLFSRELEGAVIGFTIVNVFLMPVYGTVCSEIYYRYIEHKRENLTAAIIKLDNLISVLINRKEIVVSETRKKYARSIAEYKKISVAVAEQVLEAAREGKYEKIKLLIS